MSTQIRHHVLGFDEVISENDADYTTSGLRQASLVRLGFLGSLAEAQIAGEISRVGNERLNRLRRNLVQHLQG